LESNLPFLKELAQKCLTKYGNQSEKLTLVLPNKRAGLFFRKYLSELTDKPIWSPKILSIEEFILSFSNIKPADQNYLLFALYAVYKKKIKQAETFDNFYHWGEMILNDFNDIDNYLLDPEHVFRIVKSQKELDDAFYYLPEEDQKTIQSFWASFLPKPTKTQDDFLRTWEILNLLYLEFNKLLSQKGISYKGGIYRKVAEQIDEEEFDQNDQTIWFAGFNAFTKAEERIIKYFVNEKAAEIYWDIDAYYLNDEIQESGYFFRQYLKDTVFSESIKRDANDSIKHVKKYISTHAVALSMGQVKSVGEKIKQLAANKNFVPEKTVIIIPNENLLLPILNSIPEVINQVNVTMGYPIKHSDYFIFFELLLDLIATDLQSGANRYFKSKSVISLLSHNCFSTFFADNSKSFIQDAISRNRNMLHMDELQKALPELHEAINNVSDTSLLLSSFIKYLNKVKEEALTTLDKGVIFELHKMLSNIQQSTEAFDLNLDLKSIARLFSKMGGTKVPFTGEPLLGLQIMGTLESRNLDFDHVFILDMNEGVWPKDNSNNSFIPYNIRKAFDLPVVEHSDAIQSYLFYRLLHQSSTIDIYYNNVSEFNHSGELSRYVQQIQMESGLSFNKIAVSNNITPQAIRPIVIEKTEEILKDLSRFETKGEKNDRLSPSALNTYLDCRLKFYFKYIERIKEKEELKEILDAATFGNMLHYTMEYFYQNLIDFIGSKHIQKENLINTQETLNEAISKAFEELNWKLDESLAHSGQQLIASKVIHKFASKIIEHDMEYAPFEICELEAGVEDGYKLDLVITIDGVRKEIGLKGVIDRIDKKDHVVRILDYKSGGDERNFTSIESLFDREGNKRNKAAMQVLLYCLFYKQNNSSIEELLVPGVFNSKDLFSSNFDVKIKEGRSNVINNFSAIEEDYKENLEKLLVDIFDSNIDFDQTNDTKKCEYCPYSSICMRN
jgi:hypothetical protein